MDDDFGLVVKEYQVNDSNNDDKDDDISDVIDIWNNNTHNDNNTNKDLSFLPTVEQKIANLIGYNIIDNKKSPCCQFSPEVRNKCSQYLNICCRCCIAIVGSHGWLLHITEEILLPFTNPENIRT